MAHSKPTPLAPARQSKNPPSSQPKAASSAFPIDASSNPENDSGKAASIASTPVAPRKHSKDSEWDVYVPVKGFLDIPSSELSDRARYVVLCLDGFARGHSYCYPTNDELSAATGKSVRALQEIFDELEGSWIRRIYAAGDRPDRLGFVMLRRVNPHLTVANPAATSPEEIEAAEVALRMASNQGAACGNPHAAASARHAEIRTSGMRKSARHGMRKSAPLKDEGEETQINDDDKGRSSSSDLNASEREEESLQLVCMAGTSNSYPAVGLAHPRNRPIATIVPFAAPTSPEPEPDPAPTTALADDLPSSDDQAGTNRPDAATAASEPIVEVLMPDLELLKAQARKAFPRRAEFGREIADAIPNWHEWLVLKTPSAFAWISDGIDRAANKKGLRDPVAWIKKCLTNWLAERRDECEALAAAQALAKAPAKAAVEQGGSTNLPNPEVQAAEKAKADDEAKAAAEDRAERQARWEALSEDERARRRREVEGANPDQRRWPTMIHAKCLDMI